MRKQGSGWKNESRRHSLARKGIKTVLPDGRRFDVSKFVANGRVIHGYDIDEIYKGFITAMLWATPNDYNDPSFYLESEYGIYDIDKETERAIKHLIEDFMYENYDVLDEIQINKDIHISEDQIGHDLFLTSQHHGAGFWNRGYDSGGDLLTKETHKFINDGLIAFAGDDGKIYVDGLDLKASGIKDYKVTSRKPKGFGTTRDGYKSDRTGKYYSWINTEGDLL